MEDTIPPLLCSRRGGALHTMATPRNTALHQTQRNGKNGDIPDQRKSWKKLASHSSRSVRRHCRTGCGMVHWTILRALLFTNDSMSCQSDLLLYYCDGSRPRYSTLHLFRPVIG